MLDCPKRYSPALLQHLNMFFSTQLPELVAAGLLIEGPVDIMPTSRPSVALESLEPLPDDSTFLKNAATCSDTSTPQTVHPALATSCQWQIAGFRLRFPARKLQRFVSAGDRSTHVLLGRIAAIRVALMRAKFKLQPNHIEVAMILALP